LGDVALGVDLQGIGVDHVARAPLVAHRVPRPILGHTHQLDGLTAEEDPGLGLARAAIHRRLLDHGARGLEAGQPADPGNREQGANGDEDDP
jgi:hypothetical protein